MTTTSLSLNQVRADSALTAMHKERASGPALKMEETYKKINTVLSKIFLCIGKVYKAAKDSLMQEIGSYKSLINDIKFSIDLIDAQNKSRFFVTAGLITVTAVSLISTLIFPSPITASISLGMLSTTCLVLSCLQHDGSQTRHYD